MNRFRPRVLRVLAALASACLGAAAAQSPNRPAGPETLPQPAAGAFPAPSNLKVLQGNLTGLQVRDIMNLWSNDLGVRCSQCHVDEADPAVATPSEEARFADDSKPAKTTARLMYSMTEEINSRFIATIEGSGMPVTCGTCHQGNISPAPFGQEARKRDEPVLMALQHLKPSDYQNKPCTDCHAETAQPRLYEHAPMRAEGCTACHDGHGSLNPHLLNNANVDVVCHQCHIPKLDPASGAHMPLDDKHAATKPCTACHTQVHGSNSSPVFLNVK